MRIERSQTILVTDDEPAIRELLATILRRAGYRVLVAGSVAEARLVLAEEPTPVDLAITDILMPDGDGSLLVRELTERSPATRILIVSGYTAGSEVREDLRLRNIPLLEKPFQPDDLIRCVSSLLGTGSLQQVLGASNGRLP